MNRQPEVRATNGRPVVLASRGADRSPPPGTTQIPAPRYVAATDAFRVLRAWRAWGARQRTDAESGFALVRTLDGVATPGVLLLRSESLDDRALREIECHSLLRSLPVRAPARQSLPTVEPDAIGIGRLRELDDWAIEVLLRAGAIAARSLIVGLRHRTGDYQLVVWPRLDAPDVEVDTRALTESLALWLSSR